MDRERRTVTLLEFSGSEWALGMMGQSLLDNAEFERRELLGCGEDCIIKVGNCAARLVYIKLWIGELETKHTESKGSSSLVDTARVYLLGGYLRISLITCALRATV